jgi:nucleoside 2-deoxyribosyltransferase
LLVKRIKEEIERAQFVIADLTDERPSCYFEAGYAEALKKPTIFIASKESVVNPKTPTRIHFDIHRNVNYFVNQAELRSKLKAAIEKNTKILFSKNADE